METEFERPQAKARASSFWRAVFRWHFYAGVLVMPVLLTLAVTGLGILAKPTLERGLYGDRTHVSAGTTTVPYERQVSAVQASYSGSTVRSISPPASSDRSTQIDITAAGGSDLSVYVNPYDGRVLGAIENTHRLNNVLEKIHGTLWAGTVGDYFVELVAGWTLVMMATGIYLWWPRGKGAWRTALGIRLRTPGRRRLRDLHSTPAALVAPVIVFLVLTGLPWSAFWGTNWARLSDSVHGGKNVPDTPVSGQRASSLETQGLEVAWASDRQDVPLSPTFVHTDDSGASSDDHYHVTPDSSPRQVPRALTIERVAEVGNQIGMEPGYAIGLPEGPTGVFALSNSWPSVASKERTTFVDQYSTNVLTDHGWAQYGPLAKATSFGIASHMGKQFGQANAIVMGLTCLAVIGAVVTAPIMWWKRRKYGSTGFPRKQPDRHLVRGVLAIAVASGILFPLLGASMVLVALLDKFVITRIPKLRSALGN